MVTAEEFAGETLVGPVAEGGKVARGHTVKFTASTTPLEGWYLFAWNDGTTQTVHPLTWNGEDFQVTDTFELVVSRTLEVALDITAYYSRGVAYDANGGTGSVPATVNSLTDPDYTVTLAAGSALSREDYAFTGWNTAADGSGQEYAAGEEFSLTDGYFESGNDVTLYAQWKSTLADESELASVVDTVNELISHGALDTFTAESAQAVLDAVKAAEDLMKGKPSQAQVDAAHQAVLDAVAALQVKPAASTSADKAGLAALIKLAKQYSAKSYLSDSYRKLTTAVAAASKMLANASATQAQLNDAMNSLLKAIQGLKPHYAQKVRVNATSVRVAKGKNFSIAALAYLSNGGIGQVKFNSSNPKVAKVGADGVVTGVKTGSATITVASARDGSNGKPVTAKVKIRVVAKARAITAASANVPKTLKVGKQVALKAKWTKSTATPVRVTFRSSNPQIAKVDRTGLLQAIRPGVAKIKVTVGAKTKVYTVRVSRN
jgi:uncharacterized repeat protein (TIGR02543 family)